MASLVEEGQCHEPLGPVVQHSPCSLCRSVCLGTCLSALPPPGPDGSVWWASRSPVSAFHSARVSQNQEFLPHK